MFSFFKPKPAPYSKLISTQETYQKIEDTATTVGSALTGIGVAVGARAVANNAVAAGAGVFGGLATYFATKSTSRAETIDRLKKEQEFTNKYNLHFGTSDIEEEGDVYTNVFVAEEEFDGIFVDTSTGSFPKGENHKLISNAFHTEALVVPVGKDGKHREAARQIHQSDEEVLCKEQGGIVFSTLVEDKPIHAFSVAELADAVSKKHNLQDLQKTVDAVEEVGYDYMLSQYIKEHDNPGFFMGALRTKSQTEAKRAELTEEFNKLLAMHAEFERLAETVPTAYACDDLFSSCHVFDIDGAEVVVTENMLALGDNFDVSQ